MARGLWRATLVVFLSSIWALSTCAPLTIDDILNLESIGTVETAQGGRTILFERIPSLSARKDFSTDDPRWSASVYLYRLGDPAGVRPLASNEIEDGRWLSSVSPNGSRVALYRRVGSHVEAGVVDLTSGREVWFPFTPYVDFSQRDPVWVSEDELVYSVLADGQEPSSGRFRQAAADKWAAAWQRAWQGTVPTADVLTVGAPNSGGIEGRVLRVNWRTGTIDVVCDHLLEGLRVSESGHYLAGVQRGGLREPPRTGSIDVGQGPYWFDTQVIDLWRSSPPEHVCGGCEVVIESMTWAHSRDVLSFFARKPDDLWSQALFYLYRADRKDTTAVPHRGLDLVSQRERGGDAIPESALPFADGLLMVARAQASARAEPTFSDRRYRAKGLGRIDLYYVTPAGFVQNLTADLQKLVPNFVVALDRSAYVLADGFMWRVDPAKRAVRVCCDRAGDTTSIGLTHGGATAVLYNDAGRVALTVWGEQIHRVSIPLGHDVVDAASPNGRTVVLRRATREGVSLYAATSAGEQLPFWKADSYVAGITPVRTATLRYAVGGKPARGCAMLPERWAPGRSLPAIVHLYPTVNSQCPAAYANGQIDLYEPELLASLGYVVLFASAPEEALRGPDGPMTAWPAVIDPLVDAAVREGYADSDRLGVFGLSYGAIGTLQLLARSERFRAGIAMHGAADFASHYGDLSPIRRLLAREYFQIGQSVGYESKGTKLSLEATPWESPETYIRASPLFRVTAIKTPLLLINSDLDPNYQMDQFDEIFTALFRLDRDVEYVRYWGEGHGLSSPANVRDMWSRIREWYAKYLEQDTPQETDPVISARH